MSRNKDYDDLDVVDDDDHPHGDAIRIPCPECDRLTDSLKEYHYMDYVVFLLAGAVYKNCVLVGCPSCVRGKILWRFFGNIIPANILWPIIFFPWGVGLLIASATRGHSAATKKRLAAFRYFDDDPRPPRGRRDDARLHPNVPARIESERLTSTGEIAPHEQESGGRIAAVLAIVLCWVPVLGLILSGLAWFVNRRSRMWMKTASVVVFAVSALLHVAGLVAILLHKARVI